MNKLALSDPVKMGPGIWFKMHLDAVHAVTDIKKEEFVYNTNVLCDNFKCIKCKVHFREFINSHPFEPYWNIRDHKDRDIGFFQWTWELHGQVNKMLEKPNPSLEEAYEFYSTPTAGVCTKCERATKVEVKPPTTDALPELITRGIPPLVSLYKAGEIAPYPF